MSSNWKPPCIGGLKLNFDGASKGNHGLAGFGCVVRDHNGNIIRVLCGPLGVCNSPKAKALSLLMGLRELKKMGISSCSIEGDSMETIGWGMGKECGSWKIWQHVYEVREISSLLGCSLPHVP